MIGLLSRSLRRSRPARPSTQHRLGLEWLEARDCPDGGLGSGGGGDSGSGDAPAITFNYSQGPNKTVRVEGDVTDASPGNLTVTFSGVAPGTATTDSAGHFAVTLSASALGAFRAQTIDGAGQQSNVYEVNLTNSAPSISLSAHQASGGWVLDGTVNDEFSDGLTVTFASSIGVVNGHTEPVYGTSYGFATGAVNISGSVTASVTDMWGETASADYYL